MQNYWEKSSLSLEIFLSFLFEFSWRNVIYFLCLKLYYILRFPDILLHPRSDQLNFIVRFQKSSYSASATIVLEIWPNNRNSRKVDFAISNMVEDLSFVPCYKMGDRGKETGFERSLFSRKAWTPLSPACIRVSSELIGHLGSYRGYRDRGVDMITLGTHWQQT